MPGLEGWLKVRLNGCAVEGAVLVEGGAVKVRVPREPDEKPPPTRASAFEAASTGSASDNTMAIAFTHPRICCERFMLVPQVPGRGKCP